MHRAVLQLTRILREGRAVKEELDVVIDVCGGVHNVRDAVTVAMQEEETSREAASGQSRAGKYLESYVLLICFNAYLRERSYARNRHAIRHRQALRRARVMQELKERQQQQINPGGASDTTSPTVPSSLEHIVSPVFDYPSFTQWLASRPEITLLIDHIRMYPQEALVMATFASDPYAEVYESRNGHVLGRGAILKSDAFAGISNKAIEPICDGVINFRMLSVCPVAGTGIPTLPGLVSLLSLLTAVPPVTPVTNVTSSASSSSLTLGMSMAMSMSLADISTTIPQTSPSPSPSPSPASSPMSSPAPSPSGGIGMPTAVIAGTFNPPAVTPAAAGAGAGAGAGAVSGGAAAAAAGTVVTHGGAPSPPTPSSSPSMYGFSRIVWLNLREEPILYVNGRPYVLLPCIMLPCAMLPCIMTHLSPQGQSQSLLYWIL